ncbi:hypothetical protein GCM10009582_14580 [Arthrobacter flavus]
MRIFTTVHAEPRDSVDHPTYRVNFWQQPQPDFGWNLEAFVVVDAGDVNEAIFWAEQNSRGRPYELFAEISDENVEGTERPRQSGLIRLLGKDPNSRI